jgi:hypothetical protein
MHASWWRTEPISEQGVLPPSMYFKAKSETKRPSLVCEKFSRKDQEVIYFTQRGNKAKNRGLHDPMPL